jgi:hypothetical protein
MKSRSMSSLFSDEEIALMISIWDEEHERESRKARPKRPTRSRAVKTPPDPQTTKGGRQGSSQ